MKNLEKDVFKNLKKEFPDKWQNSIKKFPYPHELFNRNDDYQKTCKEF